MVNTEKPAKSAAMLTQSVTRALAILSCFSDEEPELRVADFCRKLDLTQSNVSRLLSTMVSIGYVKKEESSGYYRLGTEIVSLGGIALNNYEIRKQSLPEMHEMERRLGLDTNLAILDDDTILYLAHVDSYESPRMYTFIGRRNPLHCTAIGKVLLAHMDETARDRLLGRIEMYAYTDKTVTDQNVLLEQLAACKRRGYAIELEELALGRACLAAPIFDKSGKIAAGISVSGSLSKMNLAGREQELAAALIELAGRVSMKMGHVTVHMNRTPHSR
ncbi:IclR family transcriptional regulator [Paenibacillus sp. IB182496]|uniref:Glycerol operon regulatory protein n=1 Tax=Paenibacillus sabuli TaxID=2772509 RepID=A0A927BUM4_9BACL|nr:IclR family transcriptional regulator [Paenibacillus sabuli]MBD2846637.1 IclR family transcriptional regulator [Paenibacillus sabuli]